MIFRLKTFFLCLAAISGCVEYIRADHDDQEDAHPINKSLRSASLDTSMLKKMTDHREVARSPSQLPRAPIPTTPHLGGERPGTEDKMIWEGNWGSWKGWKGYDYGGYYACGAEMRFEGQQSGDGDDTTGNGLKLTYCHLENWYAQNIQTIENGFWGDWKGMKMCPVGTYVDGAQVRYEHKQGGNDDTALNGLKIHCRVDGEDQGKWVDVYDGIWGEWEPAVTIPDKYVKLANVRLEGQQGKKIDDTAWNGLQFRYETPNDGLSLAVVQGMWVNIASGPTVSTSLLESMETTDGNSLSNEQSSSVSTTVEAGYEFAGASTSVSVTGEAATSTATSVSSTIALKQQQSIDVACDGSSDNGIWIMWQWHMDQPTDDTGPGFHMGSKHFRCTRSTLVPQCPLGSCATGECQECLPMSQVKFQREKE